MISKSSKSKKTKEIPENLSKSMFFFENFTGFYWFQTTSTFERLMTLFFFKDSSMGFQINSLFFVVSFFYLHFTHPNFMNTFARVQQVAISLCIFVLFLSLMCLKSLLFFFLYYFKFCDNNIDNCILSSMIKFALIRK